MTSLPKPSKRGPKPRRPIARRQRPHTARIRRSGYITFVGSAGKGKLRELADDLQSLYVRHTAGWICWTCGSRSADEMQTAHLFAKGEHHAGRFILDNVVCLDMKCHKYWTHRPSGWDNYLRSRFGQLDYELLRARCSVRQGPWDYGLVAIDYRRRLEARPDAWKIRERLDRLLERGRLLGVWR